MIMKILLYLFQIKDAIHLLGAPPGWLSGERVRLMTWWLQVRSPFEATFLSGVFSPLISVEACGMEVNHHVLQIKLEFPYAPLIFGQITGLGLTTVQRSNSFLDFFF